jgi:hypothetical protein
MITLDDDGDVSGILPAPLHTTGEVASAVPLTELDTTSWEMVQQDVESMSGESDDDYPAEALDTQVLMTAGKLRWLVSR